ncbi:hypothetical protein RSAG8_08629, partial [Rhizoctonia solani AG-8 WAC10335]
MEGPPSDNLFSITTTTRPPRYPLTAFCCVTFHLEWCKNVVNRFILALRR